MKKPLKTILVLATLMAAAVDHAQAERSDILFENFEGRDYGDWTVTGTAFGQGPARGALPNQMPVDGFKGRGLVSSFHGGDAATGMLTSIPFTVVRGYIHFLIGGGGWEGKTCMNLIVDGKAARSATGPNVDPGGSEQLEPGQWDVSEFEGKVVTLEIVDDATGGWGHICVDEIVQSDTRLDVPILKKDVSREITVEKAYINFPVKAGAPKKWVTVSASGKQERGFEIELADGAPDWWAFLDATSFKGETVSIKVNKLAESSAGLSSIDQTDGIKGGEEQYHESLRPRFHFTSRVGWLNDPNGLVYYEGEYHLFYQHNPYGWGWGNMHWGHAVSRDLVHWKELPVALYPDENGTMYSGSAVVDWNNTAGFQTGKEPALVAMFTAAGRPFTQGLAFSNDRGRTWKKYGSNPVLGHIAAENRDPKVAWYAPEKKWVMALYLDHNDFQIFESHDLKSWTKLQDLTLRGDAECPNFFELPLDGDMNKTRWVFFGANGVYVVGQFDGRKFTPETEPRRLQTGNCWYASQVYSDIPKSDGRRILVPWGRLPSGEIFRGMPFNQMMGLPVELTLHSRSGGAVLEVAPVRELASIRERTHDVNAQALSMDKNPLEGIEGDLFEIEAALAVGDAKEITFDLRGITVTYNVATRKLSCLGCESALAPVDGGIRLHIYVDRASVDIYGGDGTLYMPVAKALSNENHGLRLSCAGGTASVDSLKVYELKSAWE